MDTAYLIERNKSQAQREATSRYWKGRSRPETTGERNYAWKGEKVSYSGLHKWVNRRLGKPSKCQNRNCLNLPSRFEWANLSKKYKRNLSDWIQLCASCHRKWDKSNIIPTIL